MKRRITFAMIAMASVLMSTAFADGYETLVLKSTTGESYSVKTENLEIYFKDGKLTFSNSELNLPVSSLVSMEFADKSGGNSGVEEIAVALEGPVEIYTLDGVKAGEFSSLNDAYGSLQKGVYVVRHPNGSFKINVQ